MYSRPNGVFPILAAALLLLALATVALAAGGRADVPVLKAGKPLARALSHVPVVKLLHRIAAREGLTVTRIAQRESNSATVLTFHARPLDGGAEAARFQVLVGNTDIRVVEAPGLAAAK